MLVTIAWKNIWRNKTRSLVVITAVILGLWAGAFILAYVFGMIQQRLDDAITHEVSHLQLHHPDFKHDMDPKFTLVAGQSIISTLAEDSRVESVTGRLMVGGMVASATLSTGAVLIGIVPETEDSVTSLSTKIIEGEYLSKETKNRIVIGKRLAEKLKVRLKSKVVLTFQDSEGHIVAGAFKVQGIYQTYNSAIEQNHIYALQQDLARLLGTGEAVHEIAVLLSDVDNTSTYVKELSAAYPAALAESWRQLSPELGLMIDSLDQYMIIFFVIIMLALSFGIINTMLMAVLERVREIGMLMAIGMNKTRLFMMIALETIFMVTIAVPPGLLLAYATISYLNVHGLDLSSVYEGYAIYGFKAFIYPTLDAIYYVRIIAFVVGTAILSSIYPAITALRLDPVKAIRKL